MSKEIADRFRKMADRIEKNGEEPFGGCAMIFPPGDNVQPVEILKLDSNPDPSMFWGEIRSKADVAVAELTDKARQNMAFRR